MVDYDHSSGLCFQFTVRRCARSCFLSDAMCHNFTGKISWRGRRKL